MSDNFDPAKNIVRANDKAKHRDRPAMRAEFARATRVGDDGVFDDAGRERALEQKNAMLLSETADGEAAGRVRRAGLPAGAPPARPTKLARATTAGLNHNNAGWTDLGPHTIGGRTLVILPVRQDGRVVLYAGAASGGVWRSHNDGANWVQTEDLMPNLAVASLAADPKDASGKTLFAGTGEGCVSWHATEPEGAGIYKSTDGWSWTLIKQTQVSTANADFGRKFGYVNSLAFAKDGTTLVAATNDGIFFSTDPRHEAWTQAKKKDNTSSTPFVATIASLAAHPTAGGTLVAGAQGGAGGQPGPGGKIYLSTDSGKTWTELRKPAASNASGRTQVCFTRAKLAPGDADVQVYASVEVGSPSTDGEIWRWVKGASEVALVKKIPGLFGSTGNQGWYDNYIWAGDPSDAKLIVALGVDLYRSTNGTSFIKIGGYPQGPGQVHPDQHFMVEDPRYGQQEKLTLTEMDAGGRPVLDGNGVPKTFEADITNKRVYLGNDGGMYTTHDISSVDAAAREPKTRAEYNALKGKAWWREINHGYSVTQFYYGAGNPNSRVVIAGAQDNGTLGQTPGSYEWDAAKVSEGDGGAVAADLSDNSRWYSEYVFLNIYRVARTVDPTGTTWSAVPIWGGGYGHYDANKQWITDWFPTPYFIPDAESENCEFISPFVLDPNNSEVLLAGGASLWRTTNVTAPVDVNSQPPKWGPAWHALLPAPTGAGKINAIAIGKTPDPPPRQNDNPADYRKGDSNLVLVGYSDGKIYRTIRANATPSVAIHKPDLLQWDEIGTGANKPNARRKCLCLAIDPKSSDTFYAGFAGYQEGNLWKATNGGNRWEKMARLPHAPVHCVTIHPSISNWVYAGTDVGLFASEDGGKNWSVTNDGPASVAVFDLFWMGTTLVAVTYGRGVFQIDIPPNDKAKAILAANNEGTLFLVDGASGIITETRKPSSARGLAPILVVQDSKSLSNSLGPLLADAVKDTTFVGDILGNLHWLETSTLKSKWTKQTGGSIFARPVLWQQPEDHHLYVLVTSADGHLTAFDLSDSSKAVWSMDVLRLPAGEFAEIYSNEIMDNWAYLVTQNGLFAVRLVGESRAVEWHNSLWCEVPPLLASNKIFASARDGSLYCFDARTGERVWSAAAGDGPCQPVWSLGAVIVGTGGEVVGFDYENGRELFRKPVVGGVWGVAADNNMLYFVSRNGGELVKWALVPASTWTVNEVAKGPALGGSVQAPLVVGDKVYVNRSAGDSGLPPNRLACVHASPPPGSNTLTDVWLQPCILAGTTVTSGGLAAVY